MAYMDKPRNGLGELQQLHNSIFIPHFQRSIVSLGLLCRPLNSSVPHLEEAE
jgi:hypothetical protein